MHPSKRAFLKNAILCVIMAITLAAVATVFVSGKCEKTLDINWVRVYGDI